MNCKLGDGQVINKQSFIVTLLSSLESELEIQYRLLVAMTQEIDAGEELDSESFVILVEDTITDYALSIPKAKRLVEKSGFFYFDRCLWRYNERFEINGQKLSFSDFKQMILGEENEIHSFNNDDDSIKTSIENSLKWCIQMVKMAIESGLKGLPAFLRCEESDSLIGNKVAGTATPEALSFLCRGGSYFEKTIKTNQEKETLAAVFTFLLENTLACQCNFVGWDNGGFYPLEDQPEAEHPTIDATSIALMALCDFYSHKSMLQEITDNKIIAIDEIIQKAVIAGIDFVVRMQRPEGGFSIYQYEDEYLNGNTLNIQRENGIALPNDNCTRIIISAMGTSKGSGIFDDIKKYNYYDICSNVIKRSYEYLTNNTANVSQGQIWLPYFGKDESQYDQGDILVSSGRVNRCFVPVWWQMEAKRPEIKKYTSDFAAYWCNVSKQSGGRIGKYIFRTPKKDVYSDVTYNWKSYSDMIAGFAVLQAYNMFGIALTKEEWKTIEEAKNRVLVLQHPHGHWNLPSTTQPFLAVTVAAYDFLTAYLSAKIIE